jgi:DNA-binding response OmpR family regulator
VSPGDVAARIDLLNGSQPSGPPGDAPGRDGTLLAVVPIPGTGTSLAIVGYAIATSPVPEKPGPEKPGPAAPRRRRSHGSGLRLDHEQRRVWTDGREVELTFQEFELLAFLSAHPATVFTRDDLIERVWRRAIARDGQAIARDSRTVDVHVSRLRLKLGPRYGQCLVTEYRVGYQFRPLVP